MRCAESPWTRLYLGPGPKPIGCIFGKGWTVMVEKTVGLREKAGGLLAEAKKKKTCWVPEEIMDFRHAPYSGHRTNLTDF